MKKLLIGWSLLVLPLAASAAITDLNSFLSWLSYAINSFIYVIISLAVLVIIWGVFRYLVAGAADEEARKAGRSVIIWGVVGLAVILSIWGLVGFLVNTFGLQSANRGSFTTPVAGGVPGVIPN